MPEINEITGSISALERWLPMGELERRRATEPGRNAFSAQFAVIIDEVFPDLPTNERNRKIRMLRSLYFARLRLYALQRERNNQGNATAPDMAALARELEPSVIT